jgi:hypothetical protein
VCFGGNINPSLADTWEWDGNDWLQRTPVTSPPARMNHALAFDLARSRTVLFGGETWTPQYFADTWEWNGTDWTRRAPAQSPPARFNHAMAYDSARARTVMFGGAGTWEWKGTTWTLGEPARVGPVARFGHTIAHDSTRDTTLLFGGMTHAPEEMPWLGDTWEWNGLFWSKLSPVHAPIARAFHGMAYDTARNRMVLFGGDLDRELDDTWEWDGNDWTQRLPATVPFRRLDHRMVYDQARGRVVMFGGRDYRGFGPFADTWEWDGVDWTLRTPSVSPAARYAFGMSHDAVRGRTVLFGGRSAATSPQLSDTWEWDGNSWNLRHPTNAPPGPRAAATPWPMTPAGNGRSCSEDCRGASNAATPGSGTGPTGRKRIRSRALQRARTTP